MMVRTISQAVLGLFLMLAAAAPAVADRITVFAAASLKTALEEVAEGFETETGHTVTLSFAGSSALARQIERGAPADVFLSANTDWMDHLESLGRIEPETRVDLLANQLVLIGHGAAKEGSQDADVATLPGEGRIAMALVDAVPAGIYGKAALISLGVWDRVAPRVVQADNVRAALRLVSLGEAQLGVVYATDAAADDGVHILFTFGEETHPPIVYPVAAVNGRNRPAVAEFLAWLNGPRARATFEQHGFVVLGT